MNFSQEFIKKLKKVYPYSIFPDLAKKGDCYELMRYLNEESITEPTMTCEEILEYINDGKIDELKSYIKNRMDHYEEECEILSMLQEEANAKFGTDFEI